MTHIPLANTPRGCYDIHLQDAVLRAQAVSFSIAQSTIPFHERSIMQHKTDPWLIAFRVVFTAALLACIAFIFGNSLQDGVASSAQSRAVMQAINALLGRLHLGPLSEHIIRKLAHFSEYMLEGFLLMLCLRVYTRRFVRHISWPLLGGMTTALADETLQRFSAGRSPQVTDVWIDMAGVVSGLLVALVLLLIVRTTVDLHNVRQENRRLRAERAAYLKQQEEDKE